VLCLFVLIEIGVLGYFVNLKNYKLNFTEKGKKPHKEKVWEWDDEAGLLIHPDDRPIAKDGLLAAWCVEICETRAESFRRSTEIAKGSDMGSTASVTQFWGKIQPQTKVQLVAPYV
jgi:hypothetical protein